MNLSEHADHGFFVSLDSSSGNWERFLFSPQTLRRVRVYIYVFYHLIDKNDGFTVIIVLYLFRNVGMDISGNRH